MDTVTQLKNAIDFAKKNPDAPQSIQLRKRIESGMYNNELKQIQSQPVEQKQSIVSKVASKLEKVPGTIGAIAKTASIIDESAPTIKQYAKDVAGQYQKAGQNITEAVQPGQNPLSAGLQTAGNVAGASFAPITEIPVVKKATESIGKSISDNPILHSIIQSASKLAQEHPEASKNIEAAVNLLTLGSGKAIEKPIQNVAENVVKETGKVLQTGAKAIETKATKNTLQKSIDILKSTEDTLTKSERQAAIDEGRATVTKLGKTVYNPTSTEIRAAEILQGKLKSNPVKNVPVIKNEIKTLGQGAEKYLEDNAKKIPADQQSSMFKIARDKMSKYSTDAEMNAYDEQVKMFTKLIPGKGGFNTANFYKALKEYENNVASKLARGKEALLDPTGAASAKLSAAKDIRKVVRDTIGSLHQEFKPKMFDIASLYDALDNTIIKAEKTTGNILQRTAKKYPTATNIVKGAVVGGLGVKALTH